MDYLSYLYTPQQMSGGASFGHATRVGNWSEDYELQQHRIKCARPAWAAAVVRAAGVGGRVAGLRGGPAERARLAGSVGGQ